MELRGQQLKRWQLEVLQLQPKRRQLEVEGTEGREEAEDDRIRSSRGAGAGSRT